MLYLITEFFGQSDYFESTQRSNCAAFNDKKFPIGHPMEL